MQDYFADVIGNISVTGNVVRIEFQRLAGTDAKTKQPRYETSQRMVMPIEGFLRALDMTDQLKQKMITEGVIKKETPKKPTLNS